MLLSRNSITAAFLFFEFDSMENVILMQIS